MVTSPTGVVEAAGVAHARDGVLLAVRLPVRPFDRFNTRLLVQWLDGHGNPRWGAGAYAAPVAGRQRNQRDPILLASPDGGFVCFVRAAEGSSRDSSTVSASVPKVNGSGAPKEPWADAYPPVRGGPHGLIRMAAPSSRSWLSRLSTSMAGTM